MPEIEPPPEQRQATEPRAETLFKTHLQEIAVRTDRMFVGLLLFQWLAGICVACWISPRTWAGTNSSVHLHVWLAVFLGGTIIAYPLLMAFKRPGSLATRCSIALAQMLFSSLLIHLTGGRIETHFHIFGSLAFLAFYRDWRVLLVASAVTAADHFLRGFYLPQSMYGTLVPGGWRWAEHTSWVVFEDVFLFLSISQSRREMQHIAARQAQSAAAQEMVEAEVVARTAELRASEAHARNNEQRTRLILDNAMDAIFLMDAEGCITEWNPKAEAMLGWSQQEAVGLLNIETILPTVRCEAQTQNIKTLLANGDMLNQHLETMAQRRSGEAFPVELVISPLEQEGVRILSAFLRDITTRKQAEQSLQYNEERLREAQRIAHIGSWEYNLVTNRILWSEEMYRLFQFDPAEGVPAIERILSCIHPEDREAYQRIAETTAVSENCYELDLRLLFEKGPLTWGHTVLNVERDAEGRVLRQFGTFMDVTAQKQTELSLRKIQGKLTLAQQVAKLGSWEYDLLTGELVWSEALFRLLDMDPQQDEPDFKTCLSLYHPEDAALLDACVQQAAAEGTDYALDLRKAPESGQSTRWYHAVGKAERDETGQVVRLFGTLTDITERRAIEEAVRQSQASLNHAQAMAHVGSWERDYLAGTMVWSEEMYRLCGLEPGAITPSMEALVTYTHPLDRKRAQETMRLAMQEGKGAEIELRLVGADGILRYIFIRTEIIQDGAGQAIGSRGALTDVTERMKALQEQTKFGSLIENSNDFIAMASLDGVLLSMNRAGRKLVGLERVEEVTTTMLPDFIPAEVWDWMRQGVLPIVMRDDQWEGECQLVNVATSTVYDMQASFFLIRNPLSGEPMCLATVQRDITAQKRQETQMQRYLLVVQDQNAELEAQQQALAAANEHLEALATTDGLTGAKNHRAFQEKLAEEFKRTGRTHQPYSIVLLDVDKFKQYNDTYGHPEGDRVLKQVVCALQKVARETDYVARYGGEEFIILLPETGAEGAIRAAERFRAAIEAQEWPLRPVTASFGVATETGGTENGQQLVEWADRALYVSKEAGRNRVTHANAIIVPSQTGG